MSINLGDIAILNNKGSDYCCIIISLIIKNKAVKLMQNAFLTKKKIEHYNKNWKIMD